LRPFTFFFFELSLQEFINKHENSDMNIIITGASKGIGNALVKSLSADPAHHIIAIARDAEKLDALAEECIKNNSEAHVHPIAFDLLTPGYSFSLMPKIIEIFDNIDVLVNNAGLMIKKDFATFSDADFDALMNVNVKSAFKLTRSLLSYFARPSHIVNISSMGGMQGTAKFPGLALYSAAKGAVTVLTEALAEELTDRKISVNCLAYGAVQTEMLAQAFPGYTAPLTPEKMAEFVAWFAINGHHFFNGKVLPVSLSTP
jgi:short-subunit dehydrogenase